MNKFFLLFVFVAFFLSVDAQNIESERQKADSLFDAEQYEDALDIYSALYEKDVNNVELMKQMGICLANSGMTDSAENILLKAVEINPEFAEGYATLSEIYSAVDDYYKASFYIKKAQKYKDTVDYEMKEGAYLLLRGSLDSALAVFQNSLEKYPDNPKLYYLIANLYNYANLEDSALAYIDRALKLKQEQSYYELRADIYYKTQRFTDALNDLDKAVEIGGNNDDYVIYKAKIYNELEMYKEALQVLLPALNKSYDPDFYYYTVLAYYNLDMIDSSLYYVDEALEKAPESDLFYYLKGLIYSNMNDHLNAYLNFKAALTLAPEETEYFYRTALEKLSMNTDSTVYDFNGLFFELNQEHLKDIKKMSKSSKSKYYYSKLLTKFLTDRTSLGLDEFFMLYAGASLQKDYEPYNVASASVKNAFQKADYETAIDLALKFIENHPTSVMSYYYLANSYYSLGEYDLALEYITVYYGFMQSIASTGDGKSFESPYLIASISDEYFMLKYLDLQVTGQTLETNKKHNYDVFSCIDGDSRIKIYFNIDLFYGKK